MLVRGVVHHHIHHDADIALLRFGDELVKIGESALLRIDIFVVGDVVSEVDLRRRIDRGEPDRVHAKRLQIGKALGNAPEISDPVARGVLEAAGIIS